MRAAAAAAPTAQPCAFACWPSNTAANGVLLFISGHAQTAAARKHALTHKQRILKPRHRPLLPPAQGSSLYRCRFPLQTSDILQVRALPGLVLARHTQT